MALGFFELALEVLHSLQFGEYPSLWLGRLPDFELASYSDISLQTVEGSLHLVYIVMTTASELNGMLITFINSCTSFRN